MQKRTQGSAAARCVAAAAAAADGAPATAGWDRTTQRLVDLSTVAFIFLLLPQLVKNAQALAAGNPAALAGLSWVVRAGSGHGEWAQPCQCARALLLLCSASRGVRRAT